MYRVIKALNNNAILAIDMDDNREVILLGSGIGFGKKVNERFEGCQNCKVYFLKQAVELSITIELVNRVEPIYLEIVNRIILTAEKKFGKIDNAILLPLSDHIAFAVKRLKEGMEIHNPFTNEIRALFKEEYSVALEGRAFIREALGMDINDDEVGYITLHIHSALEGENVAFAMREAILVRTCIEKVEAELGMTVDIQSLSYNRFSTHIRYMIARAVKGETIALDMNDYVSERFPEGYKMSGSLCRMLEQELKTPIPAVEIGYLALHIERISQWYTSER